MDKRARERDKEKKLPPSKRKAKGKLVEGQITTDQIQGPWPSSPPPTPTESTPTCKTLTQKTGQAYSWERFTRFLAFPPMVRRVIYTTNAIEAASDQLRKVTRNRGHFLSDEAAVKLLWLAICNIEDKKARKRQMGVRGVSRTGGVFLPVSR